LCSYLIRQLWLQASKKVHVMIVLIEECNGGVESNNPIGQLESPIKWYVKVSANQIRAFGSISNRLERERGKGISKRVDYLFWLVRSLLYIMRKLGSQTYTHTHTHTYSHAQTQTHTTIYCSMLMLNFHLLFAGFFSIRSRLRS